MRVEKVTGTAETNNYNNSNNGYFCSYCGKKYKTAKERAECELKCAHTEEEKIEKEKKAKLEAEKKQRKEEVTKGFENAYDLMKKYLKDYGEFDTTFTTPIFPRAATPQQSSRYLWDLFNMISMM